jgi:hypothetical protein
MATGTTASRYSTDRPSAGACGSTSTSNPLTAATSATVASNPLSQRGIGGITPPRSHLTRSQPRLTDAHADDDLQWSQTVRLPAAATRRRCRHRSPDQPGDAKQPRYPGRHAGPGPHPVEQSPAAYGAVADYLAAVAARLRGSDAARVRTTDELRDGLLEAVEAYQARGRALQEAIAAAIAEFGDPHIVAEAFGPELAAVQARRVALGLLATGS